MVYLNRSSVISFSLEHVIKVPELQGKIEDLEENMAELRQDFILAIEELAVTKMPLST